MHGQERPLPCHLVEQRIVSTKLRLLLKLRAASNKQVDDWDSPMPGNFEVFLLWHIFDHC